MSDHNAPGTVPRSPWLIYGMVFVLAVALRLSYAAMVHFPAPFGDEADYRLCAQALAAGQRYPVECSTPVMRPPLLPVVMAILQQVGWGDLGLAIFQALCGGLAAVMAAASARAISGCLSRIATWSAGLLFAAHPAFVSFAGGVQTEPMFLALCMSGLWLTLMAERRQGRQQAGFAVTAGMVWAGACLTRSTALIIVAAFVAGLAWARQWRLFLGLVVGLIVAFSPWLTYTQRHFGEVLLVDNGLGWAVWIGNHPDLLPLYETNIRSSEDVARISNAPVLGDTHRVEAQLIQERGYDQLGPKGRSLMWLELAKKRFLSDPSVGLRLLKGKLIVFWRPWVLPGAYPLAAVIVSAVTYLGTWLLALIGCLALRQSKAPSWRWLRWTILLIIIGQTTAHTLVHAQGRYRLSSVEPWLLLLAAYGIAWFHQQLHMDKRMPPFPMAPIERPVERSN